jgi:hypothetical protein
MYYCVRLSTSLLKKFNTLFSLNRGQIISDIRTFSTTYLKLILNLTVLASF